MLSSKSQVVSLCEGIENIIPKHNKYIEFDNMTSEETMLNYMIKYNVFLTGPPGSGKTFMIQKYIDYCNEMNINVGITATTGIASKLLGNNSMTIHSWSGIDIIEPHHTFEMVLKKVLDKPYHVKRWKKVESLIIDEISLLDGKLFIYLDMIGKNIRNNNKPFGGIRLLIVGDFYQLPPVNGMFCFDTINNIWEDTFDHIILLKTSYRSSDNKLNRILNQIRRNKMLKPNMILALKKRNSNKILKTERFPILVPLRDMARNINNNKLKENSNTMYCFKATYNKVELKNIIQKISPLEDELVLKIGCPVIYLINDRTRGLVNGMVGTVVEFYENKPVVLFDNKRHVIDKHTWDKDDDKNKLKMEQYPLLLCYAITIHRSQGQTLSQASIVLDSRIWEKSQCYVALSRLKSLDGLNLLEFDPKVFDIISKSDIRVKEYYKKWNKKI